MAEKREGGGGFRELLEEDIDTPGKGIMTESEGSRNAANSTGCLPCLRWQVAPPLSGQSVLVIWKDRRMQFG